MLTRMASRGRYSTKLRSPLYVGLGLVVSRTRVLVHEVLDRGAQAVVRGGVRCALPRPMPAAPRRYLIVVPRPSTAAARRYLIVVPRLLPAAPLVVRRRNLIVAPGRGAAGFALLVLDRGAQAVTRGGARCASQGCVNLSWCSGRCPRRRSLCVEGI
jgi:hypothetical protein